MCTVYTGALKEQYDDFKKHVIDFRTYIYAVEVIELVMHWYKIATPLKTISLNIPIDVANEFDKRYEKDALC